MAKKIIILAGGMGKHLWPVSRQKLPKDLMEFNGKTLLQRAYGLIDTDNDDKYIFGALDPEYR